MFDCANPNGNLNPRGNPMLNGNRSSDADASDDQETTQISSLTSETASRNGLWRAVDSPELLIDPHDRPAWIPIVSLSARPRPPPSVARVSPAPTAPPGAASRLTLRATHRAHSRRDESTPNLSPDPRASKPRSGRFNPTTSSVSASLSPFRHRSGSSISSVRNLV